ncbi:MAG: SpoIIE family protein phosphatase [Spirochaeta sp.]|nr:SpoIIE family protein phosphatase [Spirochaeta sp.]
MEASQIVSTPELKHEYNKERAESLWKINRIVAPLAVLLVFFVTMFSDQVNFPLFYRDMLTGRLFAIILCSIVIISSYIPTLKNKGHIFSFLLFLGLSLMAAHLSGVMNNESSTQTYWLFINIIGCAILPISLFYSAVVVVISFAYYFIIYFSSGFIADVAFRMTLVNVGCASLGALALKVAQSRIREREFFFRKSLEKANAEIADLNEKLKDENIHLTLELEVAKHIQTVVLPQKDEYVKFEDLDIACLMIPADEVGGDYYDTISFAQNGIIAMGDVTDHGLHSGLIMMMVHTALRALSQIEKEDIKSIIKIINKLLYDFRLKTSDHRLMTLIILKYLGKGKFTMTGQHESLIILKTGGEVTDISSMDYGMFAGLEKDITPYLDTLYFELNKGDVLILYTDGITEAVNYKEEQFGKEGIIKAALPVRHNSADSIRSAVIKKCLNHIGNEKVYDDLSIMVIKKT